LKFRQIARLASAPKIVASRGRVRAGAIVRAFVSLQSINHEGHNYSAIVVVVMAPQSRSEVMKDATSNDETMTGEASEENERINSLQEENERLRERLAATEEQLRLALLLQKETVQPPEDSTMSPTRHNKKWNYRDWISTNGSKGDHHELVSQDDSEDIVSVASIDVETQTVPVKEVQGLHHRRHYVENPSTPPRHHVAELEDATTSALSRPFALKSKVSDAGISEMEKGGPHTPKSNASDESLLNDHHSLDDDCAVPVVRTGNIEEEPFCKNMADRCGWLVGLLVLQSCSSFILSNNQELLQAHIVIVQFLTMLVGAGGNCGNQASVRGM
jgi:hypothetical protein